MTNEEMERAIDFLLKSQANSEAHIQQTNEQLARTDERVSRLADQVSHVVDQVSHVVDQVAQLTDQLGSFADTQGNIMRVMTRTFEAQAQINESLRAAAVRLAEAQIGTDRRLDALIRIVEDGRNGQSK
jgi:ABC-type transporter Mla subunit MlaD